MTEAPTPEATRIDGVPARPIRLADGRDWGFSRPAPRLAPIMAQNSDTPARSTGPIGVRSYVGYPLAIDRLCAAFVAACSGGTATNQLDAFLSLASALLRAAHRLDAGEADALLAVPASDRPRLASELIALAFDGPDDDA